MVMKKLSRRELELIKYTAKGFTAKEIAKFTGLELRTIQSYIITARKKLHAKNIAHAIFIAFKENIINDLIIE
jgi:DNA-binding NarL/FixJ family response regulator